MLEFPFPCHLSQQLPTLRQPVDVLARCRCILVPPVLVKPLELRQDLPDPHLQILWKHIYESLSMAKKNSKTKVLECFGQRHRLRRLPVMPYARHRHLNWIRPRAISWMRASWSWLKYTIIQKVSKIKIRNDILDKKALYRKYCAMSVQIASLITMSKSIKTIQNNDEKHSSKPLWHHNIP